MATSTSKPCRVFAMCSLAVASIVVSVGVALMLWILLSTYGGIPDKYDYALTSTKCTQADSSDGSGMRGGNNDAWQSVKKLAADNSLRVLNVHIVPHTHDDVGWRKTVEQYYFGYNTSIDERGNVHDIISSTIQALTENTARTFTYVEMKFWTMWWFNQTDSVKDTVRYLLSTNQLTFVNGGWCMHDEATTHFIGMIDQMTLGHEFLLQELGVQPQTAWQLDPFGHSFTQAKLMTFQAGMDAIYFGRIDYQDLQRRKQSLECEGIWNTSSGSASADADSESAVFWGLTGSYGGNYGPPPGYCFDVLCPNDESLVEANTTRLLQRIQDFLHFVAIQSNQTRGNHVLLTMGEDFTFKEAHVDYANLDLLIGATMNYQLWNQVDIPSIFGSRFDRVNIFYSNPDYYTQQKHMESSMMLEEESSSVPKIEWPTTSNDFFPYSDCPHCFWTGYFTSRAAFKRYERVASSFLLAARQIDAMPSSANNSSFCQSTTASAADDDPLFVLADALGIAQHHDAVSGTAKQHVADDYSQKLAYGMSLASKYVVEKLKCLMLGGSTAAMDRPNDGFPPLANLTYCPLLNETICPLSVDATAADNTVLYVIVYNPLAQNQSSQIELPVASADTFRIERVEESDKGMYYVQTVEYVDAGFHDSNGMKLGASERNEGIAYKLVFPTGVLPPLGAVAYRIYKEPMNPFRQRESPSGAALNTTSQVTSRRHLRGGVEYMTLNTGILSAEFDISTGALIGISTGEGQRFDLNQTWGYYASFDAAIDSTDENAQSSGAYIFRPKTPNETLTPLTPRPHGAKVITTSTGMEMHVTFQHPWMKQVTRLIADKPWIEVEYAIGPIPIEDGIGKEIVTRLSTPIQNEGIFYTDSNGRDFQQRRRNFRTTWDMEVFEPVAGNYYPVNAAIYIEDSEAALTVLVDRSQGGSSLLDGSVELMVQRRTLADDHRGVDEPLNETCGGMSPYPPYGNNERMGDGVVIRGKHRIMIGAGSNGASMARSAMDAALAEPIVLIGSGPTSEPVAFRQATISGLQRELPANVMLVTFMRLPRHGVESFLLRLGHQYGIGEDSLLSKAVDVELSNLFLGYNVTSVIETTLTGNANWKDRLARRKVWKGRTSGISRLSPTATSVTLSPMELRTFIIEAEAVLQQ